MKHNEDEDGVALAGDGLANEEKFHLLRRYKLASLHSANGEAKIAFLKRAGKDIRAYADRTNYEACGDICVSVSGEFRVNIVTLKSHAGCGTSGVCTAGYANTGETIHGHGTDKIFRVNEIDAIVNTDLRAGFRTDGQNLYRFSEQDYTSGPGYLATPTGLLYQSGRGQEVDHGSY